MECVVCGGDLALLGVLGNLAHLRCINCGAPQSMSANELPANEYDEEDDLCIYS